MRCGARSAWRRFASCSKISCERMSRRIRQKKLRSNGENPMNTVRLLSAGALGMSLWLGAARAADYTTITLNIGVDRPADEVWGKIGGYCDIATWLKVT